MKFNKNDLSELRSRQQMINQYALVAESLRNSLQTWISMKLKEYKCEENKKFNVNFKNGKISEVK